MGLGLPGSRFRIYTVTGGIPNTTLEAWRLRIDGDLVPSAVELTLDDLLGLGEVESVSDFHCVTGWSVYAVRWSGVPLGTVLDRAGAPETGGFVNFHSFDGTYVESLDMDQARQPRNVVATGMDGEPLPKAQGWPARVVVPAMYGYKGTKWLSRIEVSEAKAPGYWVVRGYDDDGWVGNSNGILEDTEE